MPNYRRAFRPGGTFFFTVVTYRRTRFLCDDSARPLLHDAIANCLAAMPFILNAMVLLPDHLHAIWTLPKEDSNYSTRWGRIKADFTRAWAEAGGWQGAISESRAINHRRGVWQRRFWEHLIRDDTDYRNHMDYLHYNPIKHGYAACAHAWKWSSFHRHVANGAYDATWYCSCSGRPTAPPDFKGLDVDAMKNGFGE